MKLFAPRYFKDFKCLADKCTDSCCIGWEIDIDEERMSLYESIEGELGETLRRGIYPGSEYECAHFILTEGERCPLLRPDGLCRLIAECGEECLTEICREHPRYYNYYSDRVEVGLGLSCEAAAELLLTSPDSDLLEVCLGEREGDEDSPAAGPHLATRAELTEVAFSAESAEEIFRKMAEIAACGRGLARDAVPTLHIGDVKALLSELEGLSDGFLEGAVLGCDKALSGGESFDRFLSKFMSGFGKRIIAAGLHRHYINSAVLGEQMGGAALAYILALSVALYLYGAEERLTEKSVIRALVLCSKNIEYSVENTERIVEFGEETV